MSVILVFFMAVQALVWPWKPPLINALDCSPPQVAGHFERTF